MGQQSSFPELGKSSDAILRILEQDNGVQEIISLVRKSEVLKEQKYVRKIRNFAAKSISKTRLTRLDEWLVQKPGCSIS